VKKNDDVLILALAAGGNAAASAAHAGLSERTVRRRLADATFRARVDEARAELVGRAVGRLAAVGQLAADTLKELIGKTSPPAVRLGAARAVLEHMFRGNEVGTLAREVAELKRLLQEVDRDPGSYPRRGGAHPQAPRGQDRGSGPGAGQAAG
jgi:hypothetical protein